MSHEIVKHKFVASYTDLTARPGWRSAETNILYIVFWSSNNVDPRTYDGQMLALDCTHGEPLNRWNGNVMLPRTLWECGHDADGGMIKSYPGKNITGTGWIKSWKELAERPIPLAREDGTLTVIPRCSIYLPKDTYSLETRPEFPAYLQGELNAAWDALVVPCLSYGPGFYRLDPTVRTTTALSQFLLLRSWARDLKDHSFFVGWNEYAADTFTRLLREVPEPERKETVKFAPGMVIELYNHRYTLKEKLRSSWIGVKDGRNYRIGPKPLQSAKVIQQAAA